MSIQYLRFIVYLLCSLISYSDAFCVNKNSTCLDLCQGDRPFDLNSDYSRDTFPWDIVCDDWELVGPNSTISGRKFRSCLTCESTSSIYDPSTNIGDVYWMLCRAKPFLFLGYFLTNFCVTADNLKATFVLCAFGYPDNNQTQAYNQCNDICIGDKASMQTALVDRMNENNATLQYNYCKNGAFQRNYNTCLRCLNTLPSASGLSNCESVTNHLCYDP